MTRVSINPGRVEWCGESHRICLYDQGSGCPASVAMVFRICLSPFGRGIGCMVLGDPGKSEGWPGASNLLMTDNQRLMRWIVDGWVRRDPELCDLPAPGSMAWLDLESVLTRCK